MANGPDRDSYHRVRAVSDIPGPETMLPAPTRGKIRLFCPGHSPNPHIWICRVKHKRQAAASTERILLAVPRTSALWVSRHTCTLGEPRWQTRDRDSEGYVKSSRNTEGRASCGKVRRSPHHGTCASPRILSMYRASNPAGPDPFLSDSSRKTGGEKLPGEAALQKK